MKEISILGRTIEIQPLSKKQLKGITIGDSLAYQFYDGEYRGIRLTFLKPKMGTHPLKYAPLPPTECQT